MVSGGLGASGVFCDNEIAEPKSTRNWDSEQKRNSQIITPYALHFHRKLPNLGMEQPVKATRPLP